MLYIKDLHATIEGKEILKGINLKILPNKVYAIMGPNGGGKSTLAQVLAGHPDYKVTDGLVSIDEQDLLAMTPNERFQAGLFLSFQYPVEVAGVNFVQFLKQAVNNKLAAHDKAKLSPITIRKVIEDTAERLGLPKDLRGRFLNAGFSGGEKKKLEILQMALLQPNYIILDEPDSGLDVDALKYISKELEFQMEQGEPKSLIIITHYQKILDYIKPDEVNVLVKGKIVAKGDWYLAKQIEKDGYEQFS